MPTLILEDVPSDLYERLQKRAALRQRTPGEEAIQLLGVALGVREMEPPLPEFIPSEEFSPTFDLPPPENVVRAKGRWGPPPLPDPID
jgi:hypothetical protein